MAKVIEVFQDKAGEYRWRKIRGSKITSVQGEGHPEKARTVAAATAESEDGEFEIRDLTVDTNILPEEVENPAPPEGEIPEGAEIVPLPRPEEPPPAEV